MLAQVHDVVLVCAAWTDEECWEAEELAYPTKVIRMGRARAVLRCAGALLSSRSLQQAYLSSSEMAEAITTIRRSWKPEVAYFNTLRSAQWRGRAAGLPRVIDLDEFRSAYYTQVSSSHPSPIQRVIARLEAGRMRAEEARIVHEFDRVLVSSPVDLDSTSSKIALVRSPHALVSMAGAMERIEKRLLFVGRMNYSANVQAVRWLADEVLPLAWQKDPSIHLQIVGSEPTRDVRRLAGPRIQVVGGVPDVTPYYRSAAVSVVPVTAATGVQMKLIESLDANIATVTTPLVASQAGVRHGREVLVASTPIEWMHAIVRLIEDRGYAQRLADRGTQWAANKYSHASIRAELSGALAPYL